eukprot:1161339-Pelagomonas_calceolata.AAC.11
MPAMLFTGTQAGMLYVQVVDGAAERTASVHVNQKLAKTKKEQQQGCVLPRGNPRLQERKQ